MHVPVRLVMTQKSQYQSPLSHPVCGACPLLTQHQSYKAFTVLVARTNQDKIVDYTDAYYRFR